jgi:hypothetical protein
MKVHIFPLKLQELSLWKQTDYRQINRRKIIQIYYHVHVSHTRMNVREARWLKFWGEAILGVLAILDERK